MRFPQSLLVRPGSRGLLAKLDPSATPGLSGPAERERAAAEVLHKENLDQLRDLQYRLHAERERSLLVVLQGMDAAGKDGTIRNVFRSFDPHALRVVSFKRPTPPELAHDFLWRVHARAPSRGQVAVFNRSHYEDVLVVRVHGAISHEECAARYDHINAFERLLADGGTVILKFFLHISKEEQKKRFQARLESPAKHWKFSPGDLDERARWGDYMSAYEDALAECSTERAPWYVIPADRKWYRDWAVSTILREALESMRPALPRVDFDPRAITID
jgi:PPK2 family polyphosphate:nucleotide phosphotransferase